MIVNFSDWYWQVTGVGIYGSARGGVVSAPTTDTAYLAWSATNGPGAVVPSAKALDEALENVGLPGSGLTQQTKPGLIAYAMAKVATLLAASRSYAVTGVAGTISCDCGPSATDVSEALQWGSATPAPSGTLPWLDNNYAAFSLTAAEATAFGNAVGAYKISVFAVSTPAVTKIMAGTITTTVQIDALAWPT